VELKSGTNSVALGAGNAFNLTIMELHSSAAQNLCSVAENNTRRKLLNT